jgi:sugar-specific transcriptional regulator TrmB
MAVGDIVERLVVLGFSQYEARTYVGLVGQPAMTGYALSNATRVPQPKVYETLRRLEEKQAVLRISGEPARFVAVAPDQLLDRLEAQFRGRLAEAKQGLAELASAGGTGEPHVFEGSREWPQIAERAAAVLAGARRHVYASLHSDQLADLAEEIRAADARGVRVDLLAFGQPRLELAHGRVLAHGSTAGMIYRHHQARHLALVVDSRTALWALAPSGRDWDSLGGDDPLLTAVVKGYIRHDTYVQQIYADFQGVLEDRYGSGLDGLITPRSPAGSAVAVLAAPGPNPAVDDQDGAQRGAGSRSGRRTRPA